jgi:beta-phosphoglucomutase-like phosphatase (HAD superfamily)
MAELPAFDAVSLHVGGVLVVPDRRMLGDALTRAGVPHDGEAFFGGHYRAMAEVDRCRSRPEEFTDYTRGLVRAVGVPDDRIDAGVAALASTLALAEVWSEPVPGALAASRRLAAAGLRMAVTSNSDGTVAERLRDHGLAQVGVGPGLVVEHITDSGVLGLAKPHPAVFEATARALALPARAHLPCRRQRIVRRRRGRGRAHGGRPRRSARALPRRPCPRHLPRRLRRPAARGAAPGGRADRRGRE